MDNFLQQIIDLLNQNYGRRGAGISGWFILIMLIITILGVLSGKNVMKRHYKYLDKSLQTKVLYAKVFSEKNPEVVEYIAKLRKESQSYHLIIEEKKKGSKTIITEITKSSIKEISGYLQSETKFSIVDFI